MSRRGAILNDHGEADAVSIEPNTSNEIHGFGKLPRATSLKMRRLNQWIRVLMMTISMQIKAESHRNEKGFNHDQPLVFFTTMMVE